MTFICCTLPEKLNILFCLCCRYNRAKSVEIAVNMNQHDLMRLQNRLERQRMSLCLHALHRHARETSLPDILHIGCVQRQCILEFTPLGQNHALFGTDQTLFDHATIKRQVLQLEFEGQRVAVLEQGGIIAGSSMSSRLTK